MAETANISKVAEIISSEIFPCFGWTERGPRNENWKCVDATHHKVTHPSDIVFYYLEPYENTRTYINCDLKSYSDSTINSTQFASVLNNLGMATRCANLSPQWSEKYSIDDQYSRNIFGLLFIYNHDGAYDKDFYNKVQSISDKISIQKGVRIYIFSPKDILQLYSIATDIQILCGRGELPLNKDYSFFYPDLDDKKKVGSTWKKSASIEMLSGPWVIIQTKPDSNSNITKFFIYYRNEGSTSEEFVYLIDYLFRYQLINDEYSIQIRGVETASNCAANFEGAKIEYCSRYHLEGDSSSQVNKITFESVSHYVSKFQPIEIGMEDR